jgi:hypothetical protein
MIVEVSQFRLVLDTEEEAFLEAAEETQSGFLGKQEGFVSRDLLLDGRRSVRERRGGSGGVPGVLRPPRRQGLESMLDPGSVSMTHLSVARTW